MCLVLCRYSNGGWSLDLSQGVLERAVLHVENAYQWGSTHFTGRVCKTNLPSNTAFRGFGGPQGMLVGETAIEHLATELKVTAEELRHSNLYKEGDLTPYRMPVQKTQLSRLWTQVSDLADWPARLKSVEDFNKHNRWRKRGAVRSCFSCCPAAALRQHCCASHGFAWSLLCHPGVVTQVILPTKFGIAFGANFLNQGGALVNVYIDGTVLVSHGGVEMGQGLHTKMIQVCIWRRHGGRTLKPHVQPSSSHCNGRLQPAHWKSMSPPSTLRRPTPTKFPTAVLQLRLRPVTSTEWLFSKHVKPSKSA